MHLRIPGTGAQAETPSSLLYIHATGAWSYRGGEDDDEAWPVVAAFEV